MELGLLVGLIASSMAIIGTTHQLISMYITRKTEGLTWGWGLWILTSVLLWTGYGVYKTDMLLIVVNGILTCLLIMILLVKKSIK